MIKVLLVGGGGREDAIARKITESGGELYTIMKNKNPSIIKNSKEYVICNELDHIKILNYTVNNRIDIVFIGPDSVLDTPLVDSLYNKKIAVASPSRSAAKIETSKEYMRNLLFKYNISGNIDYEIFEDSKRIASFITKSEDEYAIKPIGLTGGKGVKVMGEQLRTRDEAISYCNEILKRDAKVLVEKKMSGEEFSLQIYSDGTHISAMPIVQDYKRAFEGDIGPNTGGMGSISDCNGLLPFIKQETVTQAKSILQKIIDSMKKENNLFKGVMYGQFMQTSDGVKIIEINSRFGDPEGINALTIFKDNFLDILYGISDGSLKTNHNYMKKATVLKYIVPNGYGIKPIAGMLEIHPNSIDKDSKIYYATVSGTTTNVRMSNSRSLAIIGIADSIPEASDIVENRLGCISGNYNLRHDIGTTDFLKKKIQKVS